MPNKYVIAIGRLLLSIVFIMSGLGKFADPASTTGMIAQTGLPMASVLTYLAAIFETVAGLAILVGFQTRIVSWLLAAFCVFTAFVFHGGAINVPGFSDGANGMLTMFNQLMMMKNITIAGGFVVLAGFGAGALSVDARLASKS